MSANITKLVFDKHNFFYYAEIWQWIYGISDKIMEGFKFSIDISICFSI